MDFLYPFSYGVRIILGLKKTGAGGSWLVDLQLSYQAARVVYLIHPANLEDPTYLGVTLTTGKLCIT
jgi:hypothetical protein